MNTIVDLDISMGKKYILDYEYLDETRNIINGEEYRLYFVMLGDKYNIVNYHGIASVLNIICKDESNGNTYNVQFDMLGSFRVNSIECLNVELCNQGSLLHISYTEKGIQYLKNHYPNEYAIYCQRVEECGEFWIKIHVKNLIEMYFAVNEEEIIRKHQVLYIGQSKQDNIFDRIENHSIIQKINREVGKRFKGKSIEIMLYDVRCKIIDRTSVEKYNAEILSSNSLGNSFELFEAIRRNEAIDISEAMLIAHFKPEYNKNLKEVNSSLKTYSRFRDVEIGSVNFTLDLFWEEAKEKSILYTDSIETETKARIITCKFTDKDIEFSYDDLEDKYY